ncbi:MAG: NADH-quinone oxidoreductase subunit N [Deltaproteobacteria bacterium]|nr:NADH-quinone oxidoreductase subunit N [Deltaproteobacteria bacterium]
MNILGDLGGLSPLWILVLTALAVLLLTVTGGDKRPAPGSSTHLAVLSLVGLFTAGVLLWNVEGTRTLFSGAIVIDGIGVLFGLTSLCGAFFGVVFAAAYLQEHGLSHGEFFSLVLFAAVGMLMVALAGDLLTLFIGIETMSLAVYVLAGYRRSSRRSQEAALKYFVYGAFASAFALFGIALLYGEVGRLSGTPALTFKALGAAFLGHEVSVAGFIGVAMLLCGLGFKIAAVPFHMWAPDVYEGAPTPSTAFMAVGIKTAAFAGVLRFVAATLIAGGERGTETAIQIFEVLGVLTMVLGNLLAIRQTQIKRMLAYSSIAHAGYVLVGVAAFIAEPKSYAVEAVAYYLFGYTAMTLGAFGVVLAFERGEDRRPDLPIERLAGTGHRYPAFGLAMALFMFSLAGIPPTAGFFGKLALFSAAVAAGRTSVVIIAVLASAIGAFYYLRVTVVMYMRAAGTEEKRVESAWLSAGLWLCAALTLVFGLLPDTYFAIAKRLVTGWLG